ncbi:probable serine incorporator isoform X2 [Phoenix dactylifera]|uniref:Probable serine incorporator isoform X2 n=1 Tax=Phoenix dactylifera TaxID=42345 RepID=A0A8B9AD12_PHODC|nr:probable serine incorporator isoform X2 [Phoenix dactylifera]
MTNEAMEDPGISSRERDTRFMENSCCTHFCLGPNPFIARYVYAILFLLASLLAWAIRDYGRSAISAFRRLKACHGARYCLGAEGVLRISFGCFLFFFVMFLSTAGTKKLDDRRNSWHSEWWPAKIIMWMGFMVVPFFIPTAFIQLYGKIAYLGAGAFLLIQLVSVISFITWLNDYCRSKKNVKTCRIQVLVLSIAAYVASILGIVLMYVWYAPKPTYRLNILFITLTLVLLQFMTFVAVLSKVKEGFLSPGLMGLYVVFLCWSAIRSEPQTEIWNQKAQAAASADWLTIMSFVISVLAMVMATFSTGIDSKCFQFKKTEAESEDDVPYGYGFFHLVFAMGGMYFAMLFIGWNAHKTMQKWTIDVGWASTWVRIVNEWLATLVYGKY